MNQVEKFLARLRDSHYDMERIFTKGSCYELFLILRTIWPQARCYYSICELQGHVLTEIDGKFYDITGMWVKIPKDLIDFAKTEPYHMAKAHRWSKHHIKTKDAVESEGSR